VSTGQITIATALRNTVFCGRDTIARTLINRHVFNTHRGGHSGQGCSPGPGDLAPEAAHSLRKLQFDKDATREIRSLLQENNRGTISSEDRITLERYLRLGQMLDLLQAKARLSLQKRRATP
jgi:hypothetical protein